MLCNPPFGTRITETRREVLAQFDLGHQWPNESGSGWERTDSLVGRQQVGLLFAELCVRQVDAGGRIGIILPNGYLGNRSKPYAVFREWLIRHARIVSVVAFPRFTFKKSGADVSASVLFLEKRPVPLTHATDAETHPFYAGIVESVGWSVSDKRAMPIFKRDPETGVYLTDKGNNLIRDNDFARVLGEMKSQRLLSTFPWLTTGVLHDAPAGWSVDFEKVISRADLSLDPKRWSQRYQDVREDVMSVEHFTIGAVADLVGEVGVPDSASDLFD